MLLKYKILIRQYGILMIQKAIKKKIKNHSYPPYSVISILIFLNLFVCLLERGKGRRKRGRETSSPYVPNLGPLLGTS